MPFVSESLNPVGNFKQLLNARINFLTGTTLANGTMGTFTSPLIDDDVSTKAAIESIGTNLAATGGAALVGTADGETVEGRLARYQVASIAGIEALTPSNGDTAYLWFSGRAGMFVFSTADLSTEVTADTAQAIYIAPDSDATGASGAWKRVFDNVANVTWFGAVGDAATNNATALQAAFDSGLGLYFPQGTYVSNSALTFGRNSYFGEGIGKTTLDFSGIGAGVSALSPDTAGFDDWAFIGMTLLGPGRDTTTSEVGVDLTSNPDASEIRYKFENVKFEDWNKAGLLISAAWNGEAERCYFQKCGDTTDIPGGSALVETGGIVFQESVSTSGWAGSGFVAKSCEYTSCSYGIYNDKGWNVVDIGGVYQYCAFPFFKSAAGAAMIVTAPWMEDFGSPSLYKEPVINGLCLIQGGRRTTGALYSPLHMFGSAGSDMDLTSYSGTQDCKVSVRSTRVDISTSKSKMRFATSNSSGTLTNWWEILDTGHLDPLNASVDIGPTTKVRNAFLSGYLGLGTSRFQSGAGTPEGVVTAPVGSLFTRTDGGAGTTLYIKESGTGNTGWVAK